MDHTSDSSSMGSYIFRLDGATVGSAPPPPSPSPPAIGVTVYAYSTADRTQPMTHPDPSHPELTLPMFLQPDSCIPVGSSSVRAACEGTTGQAGAAVRLRHYTDSACTSLDFDTDMRRDVHGNAVTSGAFVNVFDDAHPVYQVYECVDIAPPSSPSLS